MSESPYHRWIVLCPQCNKPMTLVEVYFASDGRIAADAVCIKCSKQIFSTDDIFRVVGKCNDLEKQNVGFIEGTNTIQ